MVHEKIFKSIIFVILALVLIVLSFLIVKPILFSIIFGLFLAYIFSPLNRKIKGFLREENLSALFVCLLILVVIFLPIWFLTPVIVKQTFEVYSYTQKINILGPILNQFPQIFSTTEFSRDFSVAINNLISKIASSVISNFTESLINLPNLLLNAVVVLFVFFFALRDSEKLISYVKSLSPFKQEFEKKLVEKFKTITDVILYSYIIIGIIQGLLTGIGLFIFGSPSPLLLLIVAIPASMIPVLGPWAVYIPVSIYLMASGNFYSGIGLLAYGLLFVSTIDNFLRAYITSKKSKIPAVIVLIGMIGGLYLFGILGLVLGPLALAYLMILFDLYKENKFEEIFK
ncbi:hypothetical protein COV15_01080 [Candidatus Woesearchaeota archaeon CG10_big_fil_rev_8_21_14_0_10_34_12]|nr:MAG: hypothetical protein COV15_01080 [Candidatus Woesearchaeota archaeon CG10_big_fil_rev_8_21_14_0_10_34_12]